MNPEESKISVSDRSIFLVVIKADDAQEHWPRLLQSKGKVTNITVRSTSSLRYHFMLGYAAQQRRRARAVLEQIRSDNHVFMDGQVDWNKWVDEDEEEEGKKDDFDMSDLQNFQNFGGGAFGGGLGGGMSGIGNVEAVQDDGDDSDDDDDDMPPLEQEEK